MGYVAQDLTMDVNFKLRKGCGKMLGKAGRRLGRAVRMLHKKGGPHGKNAVKKIMHVFQVMKKHCKRTGKRTVHCNDKGEAEFKQALMDAFKATKGHPVLRKAFVNFMKTMQKCFNEVKMLETSEEAESLDDDAVELELEDPKEETIDT